MSRRKEREKDEHQYIEQRIEFTERQLFQRYFFSRILRLSLLLIHEDIADTPIGLVLPVLGSSASVSPFTPRNLSKVGESLVGWLGRNHSFYAFLDQAPSVEVPNDYRLFRLQLGKEDTPKDSTIVIVPRRVKSFSLVRPVLEVMWRCLAAVYEHVEDWVSAFGPEMHGLFDPTTKFSSDRVHSDPILTGLADMVVRLGGQRADGEHRWRFCCILLPQDFMLPLHRRSLVVCAQSKGAPHRIGSTVVTPDAQPLRLSLRAFQGGSIIYRREIVDGDLTVSHSEVEEPIRSAIAVPIGGEDGMPLAVLYVTSGEANAFTQSDQGVLRMVGKMVQELLMTYGIRHSAMIRLTNILTQPGMPDVAFQEFGSENAFRRDIEDLLTKIKNTIETEEAEVSEGGRMISEIDEIYKLNQQAEAVVSFIAIDMDNRDKIINTYGDQALRNLSREIGQRIKGLVHAFFAEDCPVYRVYGARFYILLRGISLESVREKAERMRQDLTKPYRVDAQRVFVGQTIYSDDMLVLENITTRLAVLSYRYKKLQELLQQRSDEIAVPEVAAKISLTLDDALGLGENEGGNVVMAWSFEKNTFERWSPQYV